MEERMKEAGVLYEKLLMRGHQLAYPSAEQGADRRVYYLLYYIKIGFDLRETGYPAQFNHIKTNVFHCLEAFLTQELHREERIALKRMMKELLNEVWSESLLEKIMKKALKATRRLEEAEELVAV